MSYVPTLNLDDNYYEVIEIFYFLYKYLLLYIILCYRAKNSTLIFIYLQFI